MSVVRKVFNAGFFERAKAQGTILRECLRMRDRLSQRDWAAFLKRVRKGEPDVYAELTGETPRNR